VDWKPEWRAPDSQPNPSSEQQTPVIGWRGSGTECWKPTGAYPRQPDVSHHRDGTFAARPNHPRLRSPARGMLGVTCPRKADKAILCNGDAQTETTTEAKTSRTAGHAATCFASPLSPGRAASANAKEEHQPVPGPTLHKIPLIGFSGAFIREPCTSPYPCRGWLGRVGAPLEFTKRWDVC